MSIKEYLNELERIYAEIKRNNATNKTLKARVNIIKNNITEYLHEKGQHGLKYKGKAIIIEKKQKRAIKKQKEKKADIISFFGDLGVDDPDDAYVKLQEVQKGAPIEQTKIKFKKLNNF